jgi:hypothetical protein
MLVVPALAVAQSVTRADVIGAWQAQVTLAEQPGTARAWLVLWPDGLWWYGGPFMWHEHGGARWRLVGDTLWLGNDYAPYFHPMIEKRVVAIQLKGYGLSVMDPDVINQRSPYPVPDSVYWSPAFRDTTSLCAQGRPGHGGCGTWVYKVSKRGEHLVLVRLNSLSQATSTVATKAVLTRDTLLNCDPLGDGCGDPTPIDWRAYQAFIDRATMRKTPSSHR